MGKKKKKQASSKIQLAECSAVPPGTCPKLIPGHGFLFPLVLFLFCTNTTWHKEQRISILLGNKTTFTEVYSPHNPLLRSKRSHVAAGQSPPAVSVLIQGRHRSVPPRGSTAGRTLHRWPCWPSSQQHRAGASPSWSVPSWDALLCFTA